MARKSCISVLIKLFCLPLEFKNYFYWISSVLISFSFAVKVVHVVWQQGFTCVDSSVLLLFSKHTEILSINFCNRKFNIIQIKISNVHTCSISIKKNFDTYYYWLAMELWWYWVDTLRLATVGRFRNWCFEHLLV